jgi:hypothetical protein
MELTGSMSKPTAPLDNGQPMCDICGGSWRLCLKEQQEGRQQDQLDQIVEDDTPPDPGAAA